MYFISEGTGELIQGMTSVSSDRCNRNPHFPRGLGTDVFWNTNHQSTQSL